MDPYSNYFLAMGLYNLIGSLLLFTFLSERIGEALLHRSFKIIKEPYKITAAGAMWLVWAAILNVVFALINLLASNWTAISVQRDLAILNTSLYVVFTFLTICALFSKKYGNGLWVNFPIFLFWIIWGLQLLMREAIILSHP